MEKTKNGKSGGSSLMTKTLMVGTALVTLNALTAAEAHAASATGAMSAVIITPIVITNPTPLRFGNISAGPGGTVTLDTASGRTNAGPSLVGGGTISSGVMNIAGSNGLLVDVGFTATSYNVTGPGPAMAVNAFNLVTAAGGVTATATIGGTGNVTVPLGATITVGAAPGQTAGTYTGAFTLTASYQ